MKMVVAIVQNKDSSTLSKALVAANVRATRLATTGGFLREGNTTFMIGIEDKRVDEVLEIIRESCHSRTQMVASAPPLGMPMGTTTPVEVQVGGATVFVMPVESGFQF